MGVSSLVRNVSELTDPRALPNLALWLDSRYPNGIGSAMPFDGDPLASWTDLSGTGNHLTQATATKRPVWKNVKTNLLFFNEAYCSAVSQDDGIYSYWGSNLSVAPDGEVPIPAGSKVVKGTAGPNLAVYFAGSHWGKLKGFPVTPGQKVYLRASVRHSGTTGLSGILHTVFWDSSGVSSEGTSGRLTVAPNTWTELTTTGATVPATAVSVGWYVSVSTGDQTTPVYINMAQMSIGQASNPAWESPLLSDSPSIQFDGVDDLLSGASNKYLPGQEMTTYMVARGTTTTSPPPYNAVYKWGAQGINSRITIASNVAGTGVHTRIDTGTDSSTPGVVNMTSTENSGQIFWAGNWHILSHTTANGSIPQAYIDGAMIWANVNPQQPGDGQVFGGYGPQLVSVFPYSISALLVFGKKHDDATRNKVERMLSRWYGVPLA